MRLAGRAAGRHAPDAYGTKHFRVLLSSTSPCARLARLLAADQLRERGIAGTPCEAARHVVAEPAGNAATHGRLAGRGFRLTLYGVGRSLRVEGTDTRGDRQPVLPDPASDRHSVAESARGLLLVDPLADRWGVAEERFRRKTVWAEPSVA